MREYVGDILSSSRAQQRPYLSKPIPVDDLLLIRDLTVVLCGVYFVLKFGIDTLGLIFP